MDFSLPAMERVARHNRERTHEVLKGGSYDLVMAWCLNRLSPGPLWAARDHGLPMVYTINDEHPRQFRYTPRPDGARQLLRWLAERTLYRQATFLGLAPFPMLIISRALKETLLKQGAPVEGARVLHQGVPLDQFPHKPLPREAGEPLRILYAGQLSQAKGVHTLLEAARLLASEQDGGFSISIAGSGVAQYRARLADLAGCPELLGRVEFLGQVEHRQIAGLHNRHHVLVFPSIWAEPFGLAHLEAMASGCAVVSTTTGGSAELIEHGVNALAFEAADSRDLAAQLERIMHDEELRMRLVSQAGRHVKARHSLRGYMDAMEGFLMRVRDEHRV